MWQLVNQRNWLRSLKCMWKVKGMEIELYHPHPSHVNLLTLQPSEWIKDCLGVSLKTQFTHSSGLWQQQNKVPGQAVLDMSLKTWPQIPHGELSIITATTVVTTVAKKPTCSGRPGDRRWMFTTTTQKQGGTHGICHLVVWGLLLENHSDSILPLTRGDSNRLQLLSYP